MTNQANTVTVAAMRKKNHKDLEPGDEIYDATLASEHHTGWRTVSTDPQNAANGRLMVWFKDGGAAIELPGHRWPIR